MQCYSEGANGVKVATRQRAQAKRKPQDFSGVERRGELQNDAKRLLVWMP